MLSLPGYGFSNKPIQEGILFKIPDLWAKLMTDKLGYTKFVAHGGDWGSGITENLAKRYARHVLAIHLTDIPFVHTVKKPKFLSKDEKKYFIRNEVWQKKEGAYALIQGTKPQSLSYGLADSPVG